MNSDETRKPDSDKKRSDAIDPIADASATGSTGEDADVAERSEPDRGLDIEQATRQASFSRRALLEAGWSVPVILAVGLPAQATAASPGRTHSDNTRKHSDSVSTLPGLPDVHLDIGPHSDFLL